MRVGETKFKQFQVDWTEDVERGKKKFLTIMILKRIYYYIPKMMSDQHCF